MSTVFVKFTNFAQGLIVADELKDQRVVTMMSPSELDLIDEWMFKLRIRSRGEAIRRLCQIGIRADENVRSVWKLSEKAFTNRADDAKVMVALLGEDPDGLDVEDVRLLAADIIKSAMDDQMALNEAIMHLSEPIVAIRNAKSADVAIADAEKATERLTKMIAELKAKANKGKKR
ncbi:hypothetical protein [Rhizobium sp. X9]|uniref:hypothetical protein n=1 Tax=Rhizobium sp. X9 TaxID=2815360 RepID=UPI001C0E264C|nr:hypothetical protein [Rhizobium sp. X9]